jgi:hypothetical protein
MVRAVFSFSAAPRVHGSRPTSEPPPLAEEVRGIFHEVQTMVTADTFLKDVAKHEVRILRDDGVYRHVRVKQPDTYNMQFDVVTYPWHLCYSGDMGTFVFHRLEDMFEFFRGKDRRINPDYWSEKCVAIDRPDGMRAYSTAKAKDAVLYDVKQFGENWHLSKAKQRDLMAAVTDRVLIAVDDGRDELVRTAQEFKWAVGSTEHDVFPYFWETNFEEWTGRFLWCCHALPWAIAHYDVLKGGTDTKPVDAGAV